MRSIDYATDAFNYHMCVCLVAAAECMSPLPSCLPVTFIPHQTSTTAKLPIPADGRKSGTCKLKTLLLYPPANEVVRHILVSRCTSVCKQSGFHITIIILYTMKLHICVARDWRRTPTDFGVKGQGQMWSLKFALETPKLFN